MVTNVVQESVALFVLLAVLAFAVIRPKGLPEAVAAVPGALLLLALGVIDPAGSWQQVTTMAPTVIFLAAILMLSHLCDREGLFDTAGRMMARGSRGKPVRLLVLVFVVASLVTAVLSLDATVVLLTPVVFATAARVGLRPKPHVYATSHLANSASLLLPVSNLTNLLAMSAAGVGFLGFAGLMAGPWVVAILIEFLVLRWYFRGDLSLTAQDDDADEAGTEDEEGQSLPVFALVVVGLTLVGFVVLSLLDLEPFWAALAGVLVLAVKRLITGRERGQELKDLAQAANPWFVAFVLGLAIVVQAVVDHGLADALNSILPADTSYLHLLWLTLLAALLANVINNLPAVLVLLPLTQHLGPLAVLAVLIGVNVGPNLTYVGSLATLLWRRIMKDHDTKAELVEFTKLGALTTPVSLVACTTALWAVGSLMGL